MSTGKKSPIVKILIIILIVAVLSAGIFFGIREFKRSKLTEGLVEFAKSKGIVVDADALRKSINKLTNKELNTVILFANALKEKKFVQAIGQLPAVTPILTKINYIAVLDKIGK